MELPTPQDLRERRNELGLTQSALADAADVSQPLIARIEGGDVDPRLSTLRRIVSALAEAEGEVAHAEDLLHEDVVSVSPDDSVQEALSLMREEAYSQVPVIESGSPRGSLNMSAISTLGEDVEYAEVPVGEIMDESFPTVARDDTVEKVRNFLGYSKAVLVTEAGTVVGIITEEDIAAYLS